MNPTTSFKVYNASAGSGKTFSLVKEYLKVVLAAEGNYAFQNILAITFTNKAAAEMKERVLENLRSFADGENNPMLDLISVDLEIDKKSLQEKAKKILDNVLQNYSAFHITTIDSFTHKIIKTFAYDLGLPLNFEVELDGASLLSEAIDVLISKIGIDKKLTEVLIDFSIQKIGEDKSWDISLDLNTIAQLLLKEEDASQLKKLDSTRLDDFKKLEKSLSKQKKEIADKFIDFGKKGLQIIENLGVKPNDFSYSDLPNFFKKLLSFPSRKIGDIKFSGRLHSNISKGVLYTASKGAAIKAIIDGAESELIGLYTEIENYFEQNYSNYVLIQLVSKSLIPLAVLKNIENELTEIKTQNNICLNSEFNQMISAKIKDEPAPFIYERIGEKFQNYFIDEMQDTSSLQWENLIPLIENALSQEKGSLLLVGDAKQAIYRWRGGKAEQFINLASEGKNFANNPFYLKKQIEDLETNYRSYSEVIEFNNSFFTHISKFLNHHQYRELYVTGNSQLINSNEGGYVELNFIDKTDLETDEKNEAYAKRVLEIVLDVDPGFQRSDICVLVRRKKDGVQIADYLTQNGVQIISSETLLVGNSLKVQFVISLLRYIKNPLDLNAKFEALAFLYKHLAIVEKEHVFYADLIAVDGTDFFEKLKNYAIVFDFENFLQLPFYESIEEVLRAFNLFFENDAYVQSFLDFILSFQRKKMSDLSLFLEFWDAKKDKLSIAALEDSNAVRIMTIHKSKGLEFPIVIFPSELNIQNEIDPKVWYESLDTTVFSGLETSLVACGESLALTGVLGSELLEQRKMELALDNSNLLYVALTRAVEQLYIITDYKVDKKGEENTNWFSGLFINYLKSLTDENSWDSSKLTYEFGFKNKISVAHEDANEMQTEIQQTIISSSWKEHGVSIVANSSENWGSVQGSAIEYGLLVHEILSKIKTVEDVNRVVYGYLSAGKIKAENEFEIKSLLLKVVTHPELQDYFSKNMKVVCERPFLIEGQELIIPDRLVFDGDDVFIVDYKTGSLNKAHKTQIQKYGEKLSEIGYNVVRMSIVYIEKEIFVRHLVLN
ncbi:UvrD-helicase domain-containing protein [Flavicella sediminum]|uniref:UvrD-helicase domain-containing protein n=1 Tax=Flavicella sediminum TaxID=2585141 RepID=UPI00111FBF7E|nr:UvrD-helicase domain-containing protein [Flavicella sediminum]